MRWTSLALAAAFAASLQAGCKSVCQKAVDHIVECIDEYCEVTDNDPNCQHEDAAVERLRGELEAELGGECPDEAEAFVEGVANQGCHALGIDVELARLIGGFAAPDAPDEPATTGPGEVPTAGRGAARP